MVSDKIIEENLVKIKAKNAILAVATAVVGTGNDEYY